MKPLKLLLALVTFLFATSLSAQIIIGATRKAGCALHLKDGTTVNASSVKLPKAFDKKITVFINDEKKTFASADIDYLEVWGRGAQSSVSVLKYTQNLYAIVSDKPQLSKKSAWFLRIDEGQYVSHWQTAHSFKITKDGDIYLYDQVAVFDHFLWKKGEQYPVFTLNNEQYRKKAIREVWTKYLADDPVLVEKINNKEVEKYEDIVRLYQPRK